MTIYIVSIANFTDYDTIVDVFEFYPDAENEIRKQKELRGVHADDIHITEKRVWPRDTGRE